MAAAVVDESTKAMKILISVFRYHTNMVSMVDALEANGHQVRFLVLAEDPTEAEHKSVVHRLEVTQNLKNDVRSAFDKFYPDAVVVRSALNLDVAPVVAREAKIRKITCVGYEQKPCYHSHPLKALFRGLAHALGQVKKGLPVTTLSPNRGLRYGYAAPFIKYFRFPVRMQKDLEDKIYCPNNQVRITAIGKLGVKRKRLDWVVDALQSAEVDFYLVLAGANDLDRYSNRSQEYYDLIYNKSLLMRKRGIAEIRENVPFNDMSMIYQHTDVFILSAMDEPFGISPLEAMSYGCAVICPDDNGSTPYITDRHDGIVFKSSSYAAFYSSLHVLIRDKEKIESLGNNAIKTIKEKHGRGNFLEQLMTVLK